MLKTRPLLSCLLKTVAVLIVVAMTQPIARAADESVIERVLREQAETIPRQALDTAFAWYRAHPDKVRNTNYVTIINFDRPSTEKRMHVIDMNNGQVEHLLVAHGRNSGLNTADRFSNVVGSYMSSLGIYLTAETYHGKHGLSLRLDGMEPTNDNARKRAIVLHGADYVSEKVIEKQGRLGRSLGCPAVPMDASERLAKQLHGGSLMLIYKSDHEKGED